MAAREDRMSEVPTPQDAPKIGYKQPPAATRFRKGRSGNPKGRPRARHRQIPFDTVLGQLVTVREDDRERRITAAEAFILQLTQKGLAGDSAAARASLAAIEEARAKRTPEKDLEVLRIIISSFGIGSALRTLGLGVKKYPLDKQRVRWELEPWIVEAALGRFDARTLSADEQREVWRNTRTPHKVNWPAWWTEVVE
jgi:hypothetical protein